MRLGGVCALGRRNIALKLLPSSVVPEAVAAVVRDPLDGLAEEIAHDVLCRKAGRTEGSGCAWQVVAVVELRREQRLPTSFLGEKGRGTA
eukprot:1917648-Rhodomonas_salina.3